MYRGHREQKKYIAFLAIPLLCTIHHTIFHVVLKPSEQIGNAKKEGKSLKTTSGCFYSQKSQITERVFLQHGEPVGCDLLYMQILQQRLLIFSRVTRCGLQNPGQLLDGSKQNGVFCVSFLPSSGHWDSYSSDLISLILSIQIIIFCYMIQWIQTPHEQTDERCIFC